MSCRPGAPMVARFKLGKRGRQSRGNCRNSIAIAMNKCLRAALPAALACVCTLSLHAQMTKADHHLRSIPANMVWGYFSADTPAKLRIKSVETVLVDTVSLGGMTDVKP